MFLSAPVIVLNGPLCEICRFFREKLRAEEAGLDDRGADAERLHLLRETLAERLQRGARSGALIADVTLGGKITYQAVADAHGGSVVAEPAPGGGTRLRLALRAAGVQVSGLALRRPTLEEAFLALTGRPASRTQPPQDDTSGPPAISRTDTPAFKLDIVGECGTSVLDGCRRFLLFAEP